MDLSDRQKKIAGGVVGFIVLITITVIILVAIFGKHTVKAKIFGYPVIEGYILLKNKVYPNSQFIVEKYPNFKDDTEKLSNLCGATEGCVGFSTNGYLHRRIKIDSMKSSLEKDREISDKNWFGVHTYVKCDYVEGQIGTERARELCKESGCGCLDKKE